MTYKELIKELEQLKELGKEIDDCNVYAFNGKQEISVDEVRLLSFAGNRYISLTSKQ